MRLHRISSPFQLILCCTLCAPWRMLCALHRIEPLLQLMSCCMLYTSNVACVAPNRVSAPVPAPVGFARVATRTDRPVASSGTACASPHPLPSGQAVCGTPPLAGRAVCEDPPTTNQAASGLAKIHAAGKSDGPTIENLGVQNSFVLGASFVLLGEFIVLQWNTKRHTIKSDEPTFTICR